MLMAVASGDTTANRAPLAGMAWVNGGHGNTAFGSFILDKVAELSEGPRVLNLPLLLSNPDAVTDVFQVFHDDHVSGFAGLDNCLTNPVVKVTHPSLLFAR